MGPVNPAADQTLSALLRLTPWKSGIWHVETTVNVAAGAAPPGPVRVRLTVNVPFWFQVDAEGLHEVLLAGAVPAKVHVQPVADPVVEVFVHLIGTLPFHATTTCVDPAPPPCECGPMPVVASYPASFGVP